MKSSPDAEAQRLLCDQVEDIVGELGGFRWAALSPAATGVPCFMLSWNDFFYALIP